MNHAELKIEGMTCGHCVRAVDAALRGIPGVTVNRVEIGTADVSYQEGVATPEAIAAAVQEEGYAVRSIGREQ